MNNKIKIFIVLLIFNSIQIKAQDTFQQISNLFGDAISYTENFIKPATDVVSFQAASSWTTSVNKQKLWDFNLSFQTNVLITPNRKKSFDISNDDFSFFTIEGQSNVTVPSALGNDNQYFLVGDLNGSEVRLKTPEGLNQEFIAYPFIHAELGLPFGTSLSARFTPKSNLKGGSFRLYGLGIQHNLDQYFPKIQEKHINLSTQIVYINEEIGFSYLSLNTETISINVDRILSTIDTYQFQLSASKEFKKWEIMTSVIGNKNTFNYSLPKENLTDESLGNNLLYQLLQTISSDSINVLAEFSVRYSLNNHFYLQGAVSVGKFTNTNLGIQYQFNNNNNNNK